jgi:hypothetical protein
MGMMIELSRALDELNKLKADTNDGVSLYWFQRIAKALNDLPQAPFHPLPEHDIYEDANGYNPITHENENRDIENAHYEAKDDLIAQLRAELSALRAARDPQRLKEKQ